MTLQTNSPDPKLDAFLVEHDLACKDEAARWYRLTGGVSSDIWRVDLATGSLCVKRALSTLKVSACWEAPASRNADEWAWMEFAAQHCPDNVPTPLAHDAKLGVFAMSFLAPAAHPVWKQQLMDGHVEPHTARAVGQLIGHLHAVQRRRQRTACAVRHARKLPGTASRALSHRHLETPSGTRIKASVSGAANREHTDYAGARRR